MPPVYRSYRVAHYGPKWRGKGAAPLPPKYAPVHGYPPDRSCPSHLAIVGEGPGEDEDQGGFPFVGRSGQELDRFLDTYGIDPDTTFITNIGRVYKVGNPDPDAADIETWTPLLKEELNVARPYWIASVGRVSTRFFLGDVDMDAVHGVPFLVTLDWLDNGRGGRVVVVPIVHPAAGFHNTEAQAVTAYDFAQLDLTIQGRLTPRQPETADAHPNPDYRDLGDSALDLAFITDQFSRAYESVGRPLAIDTEGLPGKPWGLSFSFEPGTGYVIRKANQLALRYFADFLASYIRVGWVHVILHNSLHDLRVLRELGIVLPDGSYTDTMVLAYHLCIEPQGLKALAFRHAGMEMESYDEQVQDAQDRIALDYYRLMEAEAGFQEFEVIDGDREVRTVRVQAAPSTFPSIEPYTILERDKATGQLRERTKQPQQIARRVRDAMRDLEKGKTDAAGLRKRWSTTDELIVQVVESVIGPMREADLDDVPLPRAVRYAARDADATVRVYPILLERHRAMGLDRIGQIDHDIIPMVDRMQAVGLPVNVDYFRWLSADLARRAVEVQQAIRTQFGVWINPNSGEQVADLLFRPKSEGGYGLVATKKTKGRPDKETGELVGRRGSTVDKVLEGLRAAHPIVPPILEYRGLIKAKTSFADVAIRRAVREDGQWVVHCNFRITRVSSGRLSATGPNLMAMVGGELGEEIRAGYIAGDGYQFAEWDLNQIEMRGIASEANDAFLISMFMAGEDVHTGTADKMFKFGLTRPYSKKQIKDIKLPSGVNPRDPAKRTGFGVITGIQGPGLVDQMRLQGIIVSEQEATQWITDWLAACPGVTEYMHACHREAMAFGFVRDWAGRIRYLPGIHSPFRYVQAEAGRQSHSHKIQSGAQSIMKIGMATIWREVIPYWKAQGRYIEPVLQIHDALMLRLKGFTAAEMQELDAQVRAALFSAAPPDFRVPLDAGNGVAATWGELEH